MVRSLQGHGPQACRGRAIKKGPVTPLVRGRARRPYANRDQGLCPRCGVPPPMPAVCTGSVTASLSQPDAPKADRGRLGELQLGVVRASACASLDVRPLLIAVETQTEAVRPDPAIPRGRRPWPSVLRLHSGCKGHRASRMARPTCGLPFPAVAFEPWCIVAASRVENGAEGAGYNFLYCIKRNTHPLGPPPSGSG